jgi:hypothetical protein
MYASMGILYYLFMRDTSFLLLVLVGVLAMISSYIYKPPKTDIEDPLKVKKHITRLLGVNKLMPILIFETLNISSGVILLIILLLHLGIIQMGFQVYVMTAITVISLSVFLWLTRSMRRAWDNIKNDTKPVNYHQSLLMIATIFIQFYIFSIFYIA